MLRLGIRACQTLTSGMFLSSAGRTLIPIASASSTGPMAPLPSRCRIPTMHEASMGCSSTTVKLRVGLQFRHRYYVKPAKQQARPTGPLNDASHGFAKEHVFARSPVTAPDFADFVHLACLVVPLCSSGPTCTLHPVADTDMGYGRLNMLTSALSRLTRTRTT